MNYHSHLLDHLRSPNFITNQSIFLQEGKAQFTFSETLQIINALGKIFSTYVSVGDRVAIFLPRGIKAALSIYSVIYIGAIYVPLNYADPIERIIFLLKNTEPKLIIGEGSCPLWAKDYIWINIKEYELNNFNSESKLKIQENRLAAILHTSGSTGTPKGVALSHGAMKTFSDWAGNIFSVSTSDIIANLSPLYFDLSVFDLFTSIRYGSRLVFMPQNLTINPSAMIDWLIENKITIWYTVPSMLGFLLKKGNINKLLSSNLRLILFAGEPISKHVLLTFVETLPNIEFYNLYGPVETNVCCYWKVNHSLLKKLDFVPIGLPSCNDKIKIDNITNELMIKGPSLMDGYWINNLQPHVGWYKTGDIVDKCETGDLVYKGRIDRMFKYNGFRIEPYEIEHVLLSLPEVIETVVVLVKDEIISYVVVKNIVDKQHILSILTKILPSYMVPSQIIFLNCLPKLPNGKIDLVKIQHVEEKSVLYNVIVNPK